MPFSNIIQQKMVVIRLSRAGAKKRPFYHICVSDRRNKRDGKFIERIGFYNPIAKDTEEKIRFDHERYDHWLSVGAKPSDTVLMLLKRSKMSEEEINKIEEKKAAQQQRNQCSGAVVGSVVIAIADSFSIQTEIPVHSRSFKSWPGHAWKNPKIVLIIKSINFLTNIL